MSLSQDEKDIVTAFGISMCRCSREQIAEYADNTEKAMEEPGGLLSTGSLGVGHD